MLIDSHAHMDSIFYYNDMDKVLNKCIAEGITTIINPGSNYKSSINAVNLAEKYEYIYAAVGIHPLFVHSMNDDLLRTIEDLAKSKKVVAIGEVGLDYSFENYDRDLQKRWFEKQLLLAQKLDLPVIVHAKVENEDIIEVVQNIGLLEKGGVIHSFHGEWELAQKYIDNGFYISISGDITFEDDTMLTEVVKKIDLNRLLVETDSPFITPNPHKGKRNYPGNLKYIIENIVKIKGMEFEEISKITSLNAKKLFNIE